MAQIEMYNMLNGDPLRIAKHHTANTPELPNISVITTMSHAIQTNNVPHMF